MFPIRKQKYNKKRFPIGIILIIFLLNLYFGSKMNIYAASIPFEGEGIAFDSEGNLWMVGSLTVEYQEKYLQVL